MPIYIGGEQPQRIYLGAQQVQRVYLGSNLIWPVTTTSAFTFDDFDAAGDWLEANSTDVTAYSGGTNAQFSPVVSGLVTADMWRPSASIGSHGANSPYIRGTHPNVIDRIRRRRRSFTEVQVIVNQQGTTDNPGRLGWNEIYPSTAGDSIPAGFRHTLLNYDEQSALSFISSGTDETGFLNNLTDINPGGGFMEYMLQRNRVTTSPPASDPGQTVEEFINDLASARFFMITGNYNVLNDIFPSQVFL